MLRRRASAAGVALTVATALFATGPASAQAFTPARDDLLATRVVDIELVEDWAIEFLALQPQVRAYELVEPGHFVIISASGTELDLYLDELTQRLGEPSAQRSRLLTNFEASFHDAVATVGEEPEPDIENVIPIVRHRVFLEMLLAQDGAGAALGDAPVHRALAGDVVAVLAYSTPSGVSVMSRRSLGLEALDDDAAFALATANLAERAEGLTWVEDGGLRFAVLDGFHESAVLLLEDVWDALEAEIGGPIVVAAPTRALLAVGRADRPEDVAALRALTESYALDPYGVTSQLFVRCERRWEVLD
jgi:hypothetical protein